MKRARRRRLPAIFAVPALLAILTLAGLAAGLAGRERWAPIAWIGVGAPVALVAALLRPRRRSGQATSSTCGR